MASTITSSPFTKLVVNAVRKLYPEELADKSFDNTGLLLEAPHRPNHLNNSVLLTIDLTKGVADEAIARKDSVVISYHPIIFRPLKSLSLSNSQQTTLLRLAQEGISVYSPHTAVDAAPGGLNDWLADIITISNPGQNKIPHTQSVIKPVKDAPPSLQGAGYGKIVRYETPRALGSILKSLYSGLGRLSALSVAVPQSMPAGRKAEILIRSVGICAGSGGSMLNGLGVDLLFTGELSHHEALAATESGNILVRQPGFGVQAGEKRGVLDWVRILKSGYCQDWGGTRISEKAGEAGSRLQKSTTNAIVNFNPQTQNAATCKMANQTTTQQIHAQLLSSSFPLPSATFLTPILTPPPSRSTTPIPALLATAKHRLLSSNLTSPSLLHPSTLAFPQNITDVTKPSSTLGSDIPVQVLGIEDLSRSKWEQIEVLEMERKGERTKGREVVRVVPEENSPAGAGTQIPNQTAMANANANADFGRSNGPFKLLMQDKDANQVYGFELKRVEKIGYPPVMNIGCKIMLKKGCKVARGMVLLEPTYVVVLGGKIEGFDKKWREGRERGGNKETIGSSY
ncbi:hypothetical protein B7494_g1755 [Chlorociboria aeruginascens]|nr:hypothetical protein B7494_g1755 [Chlorociboria aeruginascens]